MARLIPSFMDDRTPPGERDVFNMLAAGPDDWVALHSLDVAPWNRGLRTEIDFVVIVPDTGIVCIEVKSHERISFEQDRWQPVQISRSPFKQASDGRHTLYRRLHELAPQFRGVPIVHCCIFPRAAFDLPPNLAVQPWELIDGRAFRAFSTGDEFCAAIKIRMQEHIEADQRISPLTSPLSRTQVDAIIGFCVPAQKRRPEAREEILRREHDIERLLREQQKPVLQLAALNDRVLVRGPAGTGKTLIAMEVARRAAEQGRRVALVCFNHLVGEWITKRINSVSPPSLPNLIVGPAVRVMAHMADVPIPSNPTSYFWETELPLRLEERLTDPDFTSMATFDYLVVDEAQDLLARTKLWQCLTGLLDGGPERGAFAIFGDFDHQLLADRDAMLESLALLEGAAAPSQWRLSENCRNYSIVGTSAGLLSGYGRNVYTNYMRTGGGTHNYDIAFYDDDREQAETLLQWLKEFRQQGYRPSEITVLSFRSGMNSVAASLVERGVKLRPAWQGGDFTGYCSVHAFKGLENKVIILTDVRLGETDFQRDLFYTGMTRATETVRVLCDRVSQETLIRWIQAKG